MTGEVLGPRSPVRPRSPVPSKKVRVASIVLLALNVGLVGTFRIGYTSDPKLWDIIGSYITAVTWLALFLSGLFFVWMMRTKTNELFGGILFLLTLGLILVLYFS